MKLARNWKDRLTKSYSSLSIIANIAIALSVSGLSVLGAISHVFAIPLLVGLAILFGILGLAGRILDQGLDDISKGVKEEGEEDDR